MPKPTIKDLAAAAGVSLATVDRVLNGRDHVRQETIDKVNAAIREIGFVRDLVAANLARKREYAFAFVLPDRADEFVAMIVRAVEEASTALRGERITTRVVRVRANDPHAVVQALSTLARDGVDGIAIMAPETPRSRDAIQRLKAQGISIVTFISDQPSAPRDRFIGIDDIDAGRTAATLIGRFCGGGPGTVLVLAETIQAHDSLDRRFGFDEVLREDFPRLRAAPTIETYGDPARTERVVANALEGTAPRAIYLMGSAPAGAIEAIESRELGGDCVIVAHELTGVTRRGLLDGRLSAVITQDVGHLVRSALRVLRSKSDNSRTLDSQERIRIEIILRSNLPRESDQRAAE